MIQITDYDVENSIYGVVVKEGYLFLAASITIILIIFNIIQKYMLRKKLDMQITKKFKICSSIGLLVYTAIIIFIMDTTKKDYFEIQKNMYFVVLTIVLILMLISLINISKEKNDSLKKGINAGIFLSVITLIVYSISKIEYNKIDHWYISNAEIIDIGEGTRMAHKPSVRIRGYDKRIDLLTTDITKFKKYFYDKKIQNIYVVYDQNDKPIMAYDMMSYEYSGDRYKKIK